MQKKSNLGKQKIKTGDKTTDCLYEAVRDYIEARGGSVVVIGGVALVQETSLKYNFGIMVRVSGRRPIIHNK